MIHNLKIRISVLGSDSLTVAFSVNNEIIEIQDYSAGGIRFNRQSRDLARYFICGMVDDQFGIGIVKIPRIPWLKICSGEFFEFQTIVAF